MVLPTEWRQAWGARFGTDDWGFDTALQMNVSSTSPIFLTDGVDIRRNILQASLTLTVPDGLYATFAATLGAGLMILATLNATTVASDEYIDDVGQFLPEHSILGTAKLDLLALADQPGSSAMVYYYGLREPLDVHGQRHVPAVDGTAEVSLTISIRSDGPLMNPGNDVQFQLQTWHRTLYQKATT